MTPKNKKESDMLDVGFEYIVYKMSSTNNDEVTPDFVRRFEILESLFCGFLLCSSSPTMLDAMSDKIKGAWERIK